MITKKKLQSQIETSRNSLNELIEKFKKLDNLDKFQNIDALYDNIQQGYLESKNLIIEQLNLYDKKIMENSSVVDTRLTEFTTKINHLNDEMLEKNQAFITEQKEAINNSIQKQQDLIFELRENLTKAQTENFNTISEKIFNQQVELNNSFKELSENINKLFNTEKEEYQKKLKKLEDNTINNLQDHIDIASKEWDNKIVSIRTDLQDVLDKHEMNLIEMITFVVNKQLNAIIVKKVVKEASDNILDAFNKSLNEIDLKSRGQIIDAIKDLINPKLEIKGIEEEKPKLILDKDAVFHKNYGKLKRCVEAKIIPMLVGPAGTGKSTAAGQIAAELDMDFYLANRIQNTFELLGFVDASGHYVTTQFYEAYSKGGLFLFDEVDASSPEALVTINTALSQGYMAFPGHETNVPMHKDFRVICAGNTSGSGSNFQYTGRNCLDAATLDRFMIIDWNYDEKMEEKIVNDKSLLELCWELRSICKDVDKDIIVSTRGIKTVEQLIINNKDKVFDLEEVFKLKFFKETSERNIKTIANLMVDRLPKNKYITIFRELSK